LQCFKLAKKSQITFGQPESSWHYPYNPMEAFSLWASRK
jgi:hypothetical protein